MRQSHFFLDAILKFMSLRASAHTGVALPKDSLRSRSVFLLVCTEIGIVIANQSADWCGNPPVHPKTIIELVGVNAYIDP